MLLSLRARRGRDVAAACTIVAGRGFAKLPRTRHISATPRAYPTRVESAGAATLVGRVAPVRFPAWKGEHHGTQILGRNSDHGCDSCYGRGRRAIQARGQGGENRHVRMVVARPVEE